MTIASGRAPRFRINPWLPVVVWAILIFVMSTSHFGADQTAAWIEPILHWLIPSASPDAVRTMHFWIRKLAHFTEYGILFLLLIRGPLRGHAVVALIACALYALLDEGHQSFVPNRTASLYDVALDCSGALFSNFMHHGITELA